MGWTYVSLVYSAGAYGDDAAADIQNILRTTAADYGICLAVMARIPANASDSDYEEVIDMLAQDTNARVVLTYLQFLDQSGLFGAARRMNKIGWFMWLASDSMGYNQYSDFSDALEGSMYVTLPFAVIPDFLDYVYSLYYRPMQMASGEQVNVKYMYCFSIRLSN